jgi:hypothetical protein
MRESTDIVSWLKTNFFPVFGPHKWTGISGIDPIVIEIYYKIVVKVAVAVRK